MLTISTHGAQFAPFDKSGKAKIWGMTPIALEKVV
jgi:hypothetical protein